MKTMQTVLLVASLLLIGWSGPSRANTSQLSGLKGVLGERLLLNVSAETAGTYRYVSPIGYRNWNKAGLSQTTEDETGLLRINLAPTLVFNDNAWPIFQFLVAGIELESREYFEGTNFALRPLVAGDPALQYRGQWDEPRVLQASFQALGKHWALKAGLVRSNWGVGLLSNDHRDSERTVFESPFGASRYADRNVRLQLAAFPWSRQQRGTNSYVPLTLAFAGDATVEDAHSDWLSGDRTYTAIGAAIFGFPGATTGLYIAHRLQDHANGGRTEVTAVDVMADVGFRMGATRLRLMGEAAILLGETSYPQSVFVEGAHDVLSHGGVARIGIEHGIFEAVVEAGWASGDDNPYDSTVRSFSFNSGYRVGTLMFGEALRTGAAASVINISDPELRDNPPRALDRVSHRGVVRDAVYINPRLALRPREDLHVWAGFLYGRSFGDYADPFWTSLAGGVAAGPNGALRKQDLGYEINLAIHHDHAFDPVTLNLRAEFAYFKPGRVFDSPAGERAPDVFGVHVNLGVRL